MDKRLAQYIRWSKIITTPVISILPQLPHLILNTSATYIEGLLLIQKGIVKIFHQLAAICQIFNMLNQIYKKKKADKAKEKSIQYDWENMTGCEIIHTVDIYYVWYKKDFFLYRHVIIVSEKYIFMKKCFYLSSAPKLA